jgi:hypothetical protein
MIPVIMNSSLGYANCFPFLISIQSCPSSIESSSPKVAATRLSYTRAASRSMQKSSSVVLEYVVNSYYFSHICSTITCSQHNKHYNFDHMVQGTRPACAAHNECRSIRLQENFIIDLTGKDSSVHIFHFFLCNNRPQKKIA